MGWIHRGKDKTVRCFKWLEEEGLCTCVPVAQRCYCLVPYFMDMRAGVAAICWFQVAFGALWLTLALLDNYLVNYSSPFLNGDPQQKTIASQLTDAIVEIALHWFDVVYSAGTIVLGVIGLIAVQDSPGIFRYTDRAMLKVAVHTRGCVFFAAMAVVRLVAALAAGFATTAITGRWWMVAIATALTVYHAYIAWSFSKRLIQQYHGDFGAPEPVMRGQTPPGVVAEPQHFRPLELIVPQGGADDISPPIIVTLLPRADENPLDFPMPMEGPKRPQFPDMDIED